MVNQHLKKASNFLEAAKLCYENGYFDSCANRSYYAMYRAAIAALEDEGYIRPTWNHGSLVTSFKTNLVKKRILYAPDLVKYLEWNYEQRIIADYKDDKVEEEDAEQSLKNAKMFIKRVKEVIADGAEKDK